MKIRNIILMAGMILLAACSDDDDKQAVEQVTGPTEVCVISCNVLADNSNQTGDLSWKNAAMHWSVWLRPKNPMCCACRVSIGTR